MIQKNIRDFNGIEFSVTEAAEWHKEFNDRTRSSQNGYNSIDELATKLKDIEIFAENIGIPDILGLQNILNGKEDVFSKNSAFNKNFGTVAGSVAEGNDGRISNGQIAFDKKVNSIAITGDVNKTLTLTLQDGSILRDSFLDIDTDTDTDSFLNSLNFNTSNGAFVAVNSDGVTNSVNLDGRYSLLNHSHSWDSITDKPTNFPPTNHNHDDFYFSKNLPIDMSFVSSYKLSIDDSLYSGFYGGSSVIIKTGVYRTGLLIHGHENGSNEVVFKYGSDDNAPTVGSIVAGNGSTYYNTVSDYRLKGGVKPIVNASEKLKKLKPKTFYFKTNKDIVVDGFLAHEVKDVVQNAVTGDKDESRSGEPVYQSIDHSKLIPVITGCLQEVLSRVEILEKNK